MSTAGCGCTWLICLLAYYVEWHMWESLAPLLFAEEHGPWWGRCSGPSRLGARIARGRRLAGSSGAKLPGVGARIIPASNSQILPAVEGAVFSLYTAPSGRNPSARLPEAVVAKGLTRGSTSRLSSDHSDFQPLWRQFNSRRNGRIRLE